MAQTDKKLATQQGFPVCVFVQRRKERLSVRAEARDEQGAEQCAGAFPSVVSDEKGLQI